MFNFSGFYYLKHEKKTRFTPKKTSKFLHKNSAHRRQGASHNLPEGAQKNPVVCRVGMGGEDCGTECGEISGKLQNTILALFRECFDPRQGGVAPQRPITPARVGVSCSSGACYPGQGPLTLNREVSCSSAAYNPGKG